MVGSLLGLRIGPERLAASETLIFAPPEGVHAAAPWLSPDGKLVAFTGTHEVRKFQIYVRSLDGHTTDALPGTERHILYGFSPDSRWLLTSYQGALTKVPVDGGEGIAIADDFGRAADWGPDDVIVQGSDEGLWLVSASGKDRTRLTTVRDNEEGHWLPHFLPGGRAVLFFIATDKYASRDSAQVAVYDLERGEQRTLFSGTSPKYAHGHVVFWRGGALWAVPFDPVALSIDKKPVPIAEGVLADAGGFASFSVSRDGALLMLQESTSTSGELQIAVITSWPANTSEVSRDP